MESITKNIKPNILIQKRDKLTEEIARYWKIIATENVLKKGQTRNYDLKNVLTQIKADYDQLVIIKLRIQCANMGIKFKDLKKDSNIINIYKLSALNEYAVKLSEMAKYHTIKPAVKAKYGKKKLNVTEEITYNYFNTKKNECSLPLNELRKKIAEFNDNTEIDSKDTPTFLVA